MTAPYTVLVTYPEPSRWARLLRRRRPDPVKVWPLCPECVQPVNAWTPRIAEGAEYQRGIESWKEPDEVKGFALQPCGHVVKRVAWMKATTT